MRKSFFLSLLFVSVLGIKSYTQSTGPVSYTLPDKIEAKPGSLFVITVNFKVEDSWYIYAPTGNNAAQGMVETQIIFMLPPGITRSGKLQLPELQLKNGHETYSGKDILMSQQFALSKELQPGSHIVKAKITYQTCNETICLPPVTEEVSITILVKKNASSAAKSQKTKRL